MDDHVWNGFEQVRKSLEDAYVSGTLDLNKFGPVQLRVKQARKLQGTLEGCNPKLWITDWLTDSLTGVKCRATSVAKNSEFVTQKRAKSVCVTDMLIK